MRALDTNVLVRFVAGDSAPQLERVTALFREVSEKQETLYVSLPVVLELIWVLSSSYGVSREELVSTLDQLVSLPFLRFEQESSVRELLSEAQRSQLDLADLLFGICGKHGGCTTTLTFDRSAARHSLFTAL
jgi:predicted nucleic-acid-binding protein